MMFSSLPTLPWRPGGRRAGTQAPGTGVVLPGLRPLCLSRLLVVCPLDAELAEDGGWFAAGGQVLPATASAGQTPVGWGAIRSCSS